MRCEEDRTQVRKLLTASFGWDVLHEDYMAASPSHGVCDSGQKSKTNTSDDDDDDDMGDPRIDPRIDGNDCSGTPMVCIGAWQLERRTPGPLGSPASADGLAGKGHLHTTGRQNKLLELLAAAVACAWPTLMVGESGSGKRSTLRKLASLTNTSLTEVRPFLSSLFFLFRFVPIVPNCFDWFRLVLSCSSTFMSTILLLIPPYLCSLRFSGRYA
jgi:hypothetical protein